MVRWHEGKAQLSRQHRASAAGGSQRGGNRRTGTKPDEGNAAVVGISRRAPREPAVGERR